MKFMIKLKNIAIIGTGGLGREVLGIIKSINKESTTWNFIGFYDDNVSDKMINGYPILDNIDSLNSKEENLAIVIGIGNPIIKEKIRKKITNSYITFPTLIHPSVVIYDETVLLGRGVVIAANCVLTVNINIGDFTYINTSSVIAHDTEIGKYSMIMPTVSISAGGIIGDGVYIGNGVKIDYYVSIESNTTIKAGSVLTR